MHSIPYVIRLCIYNIQRNECINIYNMYLSDIKLALVIQKDVGIPHGSLFKEMYFIWNTMVAFVF